MTSPPEVALAVAALCLFVAGLVMHRRTHVDLDGERWFKITFVTLLRGKVDAAGGDVADWERQIIRFIPYHPAGRIPERKVEFPVPAALVGPAVEGEIALLEQLAAEPERRRRWRVMYDDSEAAIAARLVDPVELGTDYDPVTLLGPGGGWDAVAAWAHGDETVATRVRERLNARWLVVVGGRNVGPSLATEIASAIETVDIIDATGSLEEAVKAVQEKVRAVAVTPRDRVILVGEGDGIHVVLRSLVEAVDVRDRVDAVVNLGGAILGWPNDPGALSEEKVEDWMGRWYCHEELDGDMVRLTPYLCFQWLDRESWPPGAMGLPMKNARFPEVADDDSGVLPSIEPVDLGPIPLCDDLPLDLVAKALVAVTGLWVLRRR